MKALYGLKQVEANDMSQAQQVYEEDWLQEGAQ